MMRWFARIARDNARTPMQWNAEKHAGFTTGTPWLPVTGNYPIINAEREVNDPDSVYHYYRKLIELRHQYPVIVYGEFVPMLEEDPEVYAYARVLDDVRLTVLLNWTDRTVEHSGDYYVPHKTPAGFGGCFFMLQNAKNETKNRLKMKRFAQTAKECEKVT